MAEIIASTYEIIQKLGAGGGGNVYLANHLRLGKKVVLKADKRKVTTRPELLRREVDVLKTLKSPYIPQVYDFFVEDDIVYTVMDLVEGESLDKMLKNGQTVPQPTLVRWAEQLLEALVYLHSPTHGDPPRGFIHSDIKPANLMRTPDNNICLIDFNIALALGEENVIGCSVGYSSPEHYGLDFSGENTVTEEGRAAPTETEQRTEYVANNDITVPADEAMIRPPQSSRSASTAVRLKAVIPDVRSDIYSTGATLYHLLSGRRPARYANDVMPLSTQQFSPPLVAIIAKAMEPNPNLRYQSAQEMLDAFRNLRRNDPRTRRMRRSKNAACGIFALLFCVGISSTFIGLKRMQTTEQWLKLAEYSKDAMQKGDRAAALSFAMQAFPEQGSPLVPAYRPEAQTALTEALGVYDLADSFKSHGTVELPSAPLYLALAPDGATAACVYSGNVAVIDTASCQVTATLPAEVSALSEAAFLDNTRLVLAGNGGIGVYDIAGGSMLWQGDPATALSISGDGSKIAAIYRDETTATLYDARSGTVLSTVDFNGRHQQIVTNDIFANPNNNLLALNEDGSLLGVSFEDGSLSLFTPGEPEAEQILLDAGSDYTHFEGGFSAQYFAFSATGTQESVFAVVDTVAGEQTGGFQAEEPFGVQTDANGIYVQTQNLLVQLDPVSGDQLPLVTTPEAVGPFSVDKNHTLISTQKAFTFFNRQAEQTESFPQTIAADFVKLCNSVAVVANREEPSVRILEFESHPEAEIFAYDPAVKHDEARLSADGQTVMLFDYQTANLYNVDGTPCGKVEIPNPEQVYDQQFRRDGTTSYLEVIYYDGTVLMYDASDGKQIGREQRDPPDKTLYEEFLTENLRVESPLHGTPTVYDVQTGKQVAQLEQDAYLTYFTQAGNYYVAQYVTTDGENYGELLNAHCEVLARLPNLCDVTQDSLFFDYPTGNMRKTCIFDINDLINNAKKTGE